MFFYPVFVAALLFSSSSSSVLAVYWPSGGYGLVEPISGCPSGFSPGWRYHDTEDTNPSNSWSSSYHLKGDKSSSGMKWHFCMRHSFSGGNWPSGAYCVFKMHGQVCPGGFSESYSHWDDEDSGNANGAGGFLPHGTYNTNTRIHFCCRRDADPCNDITLPSAVPFIMFPVDEESCQEVKRMKVEREYFYWDDEDTGNINSQGGSSVRPYHQSSGNHKLHFCYYSPSPTNG
eukprot:m.309873 g.309873  ORF g.309873 m.309873 type:complete len:231 (+) comp48369_c0_seq1:130-822(+)